jgi:3-hydroxyisobutyrate dehydrogenase
MTTICAACAKARRGAFESMGPGTVFVDHTTVSAEVTRHLAADAAARGAGFVDAPVSGGQAGAENGQLSIMCGGPQADYDKAEPVMAVYARMCRRMGETGAGQLTKMVNQICIAGLVQGLAEGLNFAQKAGLDGAAVAEVISQGAAGSWQMVNRHKTMLDDEFDFGFAVDWMRKDLGICLAEANRPTALVEFYKDVQRRAPAGHRAGRSVLQGRAAPKMGGGRWDTSSLIRRLRIARWSKRWWHLAGPMMRSPHMTPGSHSTGRALA